MKNLELNQMENLQGGETTNRDCMLRGAGMALSILTGVFAVTIVLAATSGDCYEL